MSSYQFDFSILLTEKYTNMLVSGLVTTIELSVISCVLAFFLGLNLAVMRLAHFSPIRIFAQCYLEFFRNTPLIVQLFFWYFGSYQVLPTVVNDWLNTMNFEFAAAVIALTFYTSAFIAEDIRSGISSIPKEQMEAARSSGFSYVRSMHYIILPQAVRLTIPPLINQFLNLAKNSSMAMVIGVAEITYQARQIESQSFKSFEAFFAATLIYVCFSFVISGIITIYDKKVLNPIGKGTV
ncbi:amino acid ABC transporter permease [Pigmentibacter sp. JX0631]|uniref:amino acid ABC transporter permease n=1 Tax=Pigmentibacter sp. JX0631 TaxID=2976982 RepID=UPI002468532D|nr:amino acid ABC transporter permease [Pigmentibacter sp. JX0631]WGL59883.1 amino acid ABC transporter permease [Pigmentibacter sp. JX0631]